MSEQFPDFGSVSDGARARSMAERLERENSELREAIDRLSLVTKAIWELVADPQGLHLYDVVKKMDEIDRRDGRKDGRSTKRVFECKSCGRAMNRRKRKCVYCGYENPRHDPFDVL